MEIWEFGRELRMVITQGGRPVDAGWFCDQTDLFDVDLLPQV